MIEEKCALAVELRIYSGCCSIERKKDPFKLFHQKMKSMWLFMLVSVVGTLTWEHPVMLLCAPLEETVHFTAADTPSSWTANT